MKFNRYLYAAAALGTWAFVVWLAVEVTGPMGQGAQIAVGVAIGALYALVSTAVGLYLRELNGRIVRAVREELERDDVDALAESVTPWPHGPWAELGHTWQPRPGRHRLMDDTQSMDLGELRNAPEPDTSPALFTHDELFGDATMVSLAERFTDVTESAPRQLFPDGE